MFIKRTLSTVQFLYIDQLAKQMKNNVVLIFKKKGKKMCVVMVMAEELLGRVGRLFFMGLVSFEKEYSYHLSFSRLNLPRKLSR